MTNQRNGATGGPEHARANLFTTSNCEYFTAINHNTSPHSPTRIIRRNIRREMSATTRASRTLNKGGSAGVEDVTVSSIASRELEAGLDTFLEAFVNNDRARNHGVLLIKNVPSSK